MHHPLPTKGAQHSPGFLGKSIETHQNNPLWGGCVGLTVGGFGLGALWAGHGPLHTPAAIRAGQSYSCAFFQERREHSACFLALKS